MSLRRISKQQILQMHSKMIIKTGGIDGLRDEGLLDSAMAAPFQSFAGVEIYPSIQQKAARLCYGIVKNHPFLDGNKRIGAHAMLSFLMLNSLALKCSDEELSDIIISLAAGRIGQDELCRWVESKTVAMKRSFQIQVDEPAEPERPSVLKTLHEKKEAIAEQPRTSKGQTRDSLEKDDR